MIEITKRQYLTYLKKIIKREIDDFKVYSKEFSKNPSHDVSELLTKSIEGINKYRYLQSTTNTLPTTYKYFIIEEEGTLYRLKFPIKDIQEKVVANMNLGGEDTTLDDEETPCQPKEYIS